MVGTESKEKAGKEDRIVAYNFTKDNTYYPFVSDTGLPVDSIDHKKSKIFYII